MILGRGKAAKTVLPSVNARKEASSAEQALFITTVSPALPNVFFHHDSFKASRASWTVLQTITPLPAAKAVGFHDDGRPHF